MSSFKIKQQLFCGLSVKGTRPGVFLNQSIRTSIDPLADRRVLPTLPLYRRSGRKRNVSFTECCATSLLSTDLSVSKLSLGTMMMGSFHSYEESVALLDFAYENGVTLFDTAEMYPVPQSATTRGQSERILGKWMKHRPRDRITVSTKVAGPSGKMTWIRNGPKALDRWNMKEALNGSLERLQTDYIDIYYLHWPDRSVPMFGDTDYHPSFHFKYIPFEEQYETLAGFVEEGKVRRIGLSNETPFGLMKFCQLTKSHSSCPPIYCLQNSYHLLCRTVDIGLAECCHEEDVCIHAYSPLAMGLLTGKYRNGGPQNARFNYYKGHFAENEYRYRSKCNINTSIEAYASLAQATGISLTEMALRFVLHHPLIETSIMGATSVEQLKQNLSFINHPPLDADLLTQINAIHQRYPNPAP